MTIRKLCKIYFCFFFVSSLNCFEFVQYGNGRNLIVFLDRYSQDEYSFDKMYNNEISQLLESYSSDVTSIIYISQQCYVAKSKGIPLSQNGILLSADFINSPIAKTEFYYSTFFNNGNQTIHQDNLKLVDYIEQLNYDKVLLINLVKSFDGCELYSVGAKESNFISNFIDKSEVNIHFRHPRLNGISSFFNQKENFFYVTAGYDFVAYIINSKKTDIVSKIFKSSNKSYALKKYLSYIKSSLPDGVISDNVLPVDFEEKYNSILNQDELLLYVNKNNRLFSDYVPNDLVNVSRIVPCERGDLFLREIILDDFMEMIASSEKDGAKLKVISAYRSYNTQNLIYHRWLKALGEREAKRVSAYPGASQHQLGTVIDFNILDEKFEDSLEGEWLNKNAFKFGFVLSYPKNMEDITGYRFEPWHFRYIGREAAYLVKQYFNGNLESFLSWYWSLKSIQG